ncbi:hydantoinase B/oxoprolinase family protein [Acuticoccus mangrovi]|uniref:Hydantoinase B/oxoprolinase family protein n=1 Tax=Acuticoccus mangrovi TaxID=2796142 RepID=A0A934MIK6_9HYPH|nr:hydantoinase B/oxoprolinase family protein [Acuticoccus mangrovi]MBJ3778873.1 hydantoinase B/oxoprolinase family protein [Acuticoccus mangrovi]
MTIQQPKLSAIRLQVMWTRLMAVAEEQAQTLVRAAFSPVVRESADLSAGIFDVEGRMLVQAVTGTPGHVNTMARSVSYFLETFPAETAEEGDVYVTNDPWQGTGHLNDFVVVTPWFHRGRLVAYFACTAHMTDVGGIGLSPGGTDLYMEGVLVPLMKLVEGGRLNQAMLTIVKANSRKSSEIEGDIHSLIASNQAAGQRLSELLDEVGAPDLKLLGEYIIETSRAAVLERIRALPKTEAHHTMVIDGYEAPVSLSVAIKVTDDGIDVDWSGSSPASRFGINVPLNYTAAYSCYALTCAIAPDVPNNHGSLSVYNVTAPRGSILRAEWPQPVSCRHVVGLLIPDAVFGAFDKIVPGVAPAESCSAHWTLTFRGQGRTEPFIISIITTGGCGARPGLDGLSATSFPSKVKASSVEIVEAATPLVFWKREFWCGSGGDGEARGGLGQDMVVGSLGGHPYTLYAAFDRMEHPAAGRAGGGPGAAGELHLGSGKRLPGKGAFEIPADERLFVRTPGGGGNGEPGRRSAEARAADRSAGYVPSDPA